MRTNTYRVTLVLIVIGLMAFSYKYAIGLIQGRTCETLWISWLYRDSPMIRDVIPMDLALLLLAGGILYYIIHYFRDTMWSIAASIHIPDKLSLTPLARVVERFLTNNYALQREALRHLPSETRSLIDVGCGGAVYLDDLQNVHKIGVDANPKRLNVARRHCNETYLADVTTGLDGLRADAVLCFEVIEHLTDTQGETLLRDLEKYPTVIITTPREFFNVSRNGYERHLSYWPPERLAHWGYEYVGGKNAPPSNIYVKRALHNHV